MLSSVDGKSYVSGLLSDLQKVLDCVNHNIPQKRRFLQEPLGVTSLKDCILHTHVMLLCTHLNRINVIFIVCKDSMHLQLK
jgi:hypothetical protein